MAFGLKRAELQEWKQRAASGEIAFLTHYWQDPRFPDYTTVTKVACQDLDRLAHWGERYGLKREWIDYREHYSHYDLLGETQQEILRAEGMLWQLERLQPR